MLVTDEGITIEVKLLQPLNAPQPLFVIDNGIVTAFKFVEPAKALLVILVTL